MGDGHWYLIPVPTPARSGPCWSATAQRVKGEGERRRGELLQAADVESGGGAALDEPLDDRRLTRAGLFVDVVPLPGTCRTRPLRQRLRAPAMLAGGSYGSTVPLTASTATFEFARCPASPDACVGEMSPHTYCHHCADAASAWYSSCRCQPAGSGRGAPTARCTGERTEASVSCHPCRSSAAWPR
jgi:hypothetical protein